MYSSTSPAFQVRKTTAESGRWLSMNTRGGGLHGCVHGGGMDAQRGWSAIVSVSLPVMELVVTSVAVTVCVPTVLNATCHGAPDVHRDERVGGQGQLCCRVG